MDNALDRAGLEKLLHYDPETGLFFWKVAQGRQAAGAPAGYQQKNGYVRVRLHGRQYLASRLAFLLMTGKWPPNQIDHRNQNPSDNRWSNLRSATQSQNSANGPIRKNNTSGFIGVSWDISKKRWQATIRVNRKQRHLGRYGTKEEARAAYLAAAQKAFGEFAPPSLSENST